MLLYLTKATGRPVNVLDKVEIRICPIQFEFDHQVLIVDIVNACRFVVDFKNNVLIIRKSGNAFYIRYVRKISGHDKSKYCTNLKKIISFKAETDTRKKP